jgi:Protein of unknown function (DUF3011)
MRPGRNRSSAFNRQRWLIVTTLFAALSGGYLAASANYCFQDRVSCNSNDNRRNWCNVDTRGGVRLYKQKSDSPCIQGRTWGYNRNGIWVDRGCRAEFEVGRYGGGSGGGYGGRTISCESNDMRRNWCNVDTRGGVRLSRQKSDSPCVQGRTWGYNRNGIWVDRGCRGEFQIGR